MCLSDPQAVVGYWYFTFADAGKQSVRNMLCSLAKDLFSNHRDIPDELKAAFESTNQGQQRPTTAQLVEILRVLLHGLRAVYLVIDAIDECSNSEGERTRLLEVITTVLSWQVPEVHLLLSSRREVDIVDFVDSVKNEYSCEAVTAQGQGLDHDIADYLDHRLATPPFLRWKSELKSYVKNMLVSKADGM